MNSNRFDSAKGEDPSDWFDEWRKHVKPFPLGKQFFVIPAWTSGKTPRGLVPLILDDRRSFGIGTHPTTQMVVEAVEDQFRYNFVASLVDIGCGSGVICIVAEKLGARRAEGVDIDENGITAARENASHNDCRALSFALGSAELVRGQFDLVVCNMISSEMKSVSDSFRRILAPNGRLILSGLLVEEENSVIDFLDLDVEGRSERDGWLLLVGRLR